MKQLSDTGFTQVATIFRVLGDPVRLKILDLLRREGELTVGVIAERMGCSQPNASRQLARLAQGNIVARRRDGSRVHYFIEDRSILGLCETVCGRLEQQADHRADALYEPSQRATG
jgi:DNA-binding transcriptional ArsR family regulator